jgi:hypothetical protein
VERQGRRTRVSSADRRAVCQWPADRGFVPRVRLLGAVDLEVGEAIGPAGGAARRSRHDGDSHAQASTSGRASAERRRAHRARAIAKRKTTSSKLTPSKNEKLPGTGSKVWSRSSSAYRTCYLRMHVSALPDRAGVGEAACETTSEYRNLSGDAGIVAHEYGTN